jgi:hypothetical protein
VSACTAERAAESRHRSAHRQTAAKASLWTQTRHTTTEQM